MVVDPVHDALAPLCGLCVQDVPIHRLLGAVAQIVAGALSAADAVTVCLGPPEEPTATASSNTLGAAVDADTVRCGAGPAVDAYVLGGAVLVPDLRTGSTDDRVPVRTALAVPVRHADEAVGVLGVYALAPGAIDPAAVPAVEQLASVVGTVVATARQREHLRSVVDNLERALVARQEIDEAKGIVMAHRRCSPHEAFAYLADVSQRRNIKLRDLAAQVVRQVGASSSITVR